MTWLLCHLRLGHCAKAGLFLFLFCDILPKIMANMFDFITLNTLTTTCTTGDTFRFFTHRHIYSTTDGIFHLLHHALVK